MADIDFTPEEAQQPQIDFTPEAPTKPESTLHKLLFGREAAEGLRAGIQSLVPQSVGAAARMAFYTPAEESPRIIKEAYDVLRGVPVAQAIPESQALVGFTGKPLREQVKIGTELAGQVAMAGAVALGLRGPKLSETLKPILDRSEISPLTAATEREVIPSAIEEGKIQKGIQPERIGTAQGENVPAYPPQVREAGGEQAGRGDSLRAATQVPQEIAPVPQPEQPVSEAGQAPAVAGQPKIISTAVQTPQGIIRGEGFEPHDSIAARVATERPLPTTETGKPKTQFQVGDTIRWTEEDNQGRKTYPSGKVTAVNREHPDMKAFYQVEGQEYPIREDLARPISSEYRVWFRQPGDDLPSWKSIPNAKNVSLESAPNYEFFTYKGEGKQGKWYVVEKSTGMALNESPTRQAAIAKAESQIQSRGLDQFQKDLDYAREQQAQPVSEGGTRPSGVAAALPEEQKGFIIRDEQGNERFTNDRGEAAKIANAAGQVKPENAGTTELHSQQLAEPVSATRETPAVATLAETKPTEPAAVSGAETPPAAASTVDHPAVADFKETTTSSPQSLGILPRPSEFVRQDVSRVVTGISKGFRQIRAALTPANVSPIAGQTARIIREHAGQLARDREIATVALRDAAQILRRNSKAENLAIIDRLEKGQSLGNKGLDDYRTIRQAAYDQRIKQVQEVNPKAMQDLIENYFPHIWTRESIERLAGNIDKIPTDNAWARIFGKRPLAGPASFLKQRTIPTTAEGIALGLEPVTTNPVALDLLKMNEMDRYVMGHKIMQEMKDNGLAKFVPAGERPDFGHIKINDRIARVYGPRGWKIVDEQGRQMPGQKVLGDYYAPEDAARIINNYLSPGLRGNAVYDAFRLLGNSMNQVQLGISAYHAFFTAIDSATSTIALGLEQIARSGGSAAEITKGAGQIAKGFVETPVGSMIENLWRGNKFLREYSKPGTTNAELAKIVDAATAGGARVRMDTFYNTGAVERFFDALKSGNYTGAVLRAPLALVQTVAKPLMEYTVPRLKLGIISQQLEFELSKLPKNATQDQVRIVAGRVVDSVDNRMGQLIHDNLFWNKALKDGLMASVRSVGWNLGDIRELGGGALDSITAPKRAYTALTKGTEIADNPVFTKRMAYTFALPFYVGVLGSVYQYLMTGKPPESIQDAFMPRTGRRKPDGTEERVMLPTYMKDIYPLALASAREGVTGFISRGYRMAVNKLHPALSSIGQMIHNQDYYGNQILSPDDPLIQQHPTMGKIYREAEFIAKQFQPFSFRGVAQREGGAKEKLQAVAGIMPATRELTDTPAMRMIHDINLTKRPAGGYTKSQQQKRQDRRAAQTGEDLRPTLFKRLSNEEKARVLEVATPEERAVFQSGSTGRSRIRRTR